MDATFTNSTLHLLDEQLSYIASVMFMSVQIINFSLGIPLNAYMIFIFTRAGGLDAVFTLNQSISEILFALSAVHYTVCVVDNNLCSSKLKGFFVGLFISARPLFQCCVCLERYLAVVHPLIFLKFKPRRHRLASLTVIWALVLISSINAMLTFPEVHFKFFGSCYLVILVVDLFCCASVLKVLRRPGPGDRRGESGKNDSKKKSFEVVLINLVTFLIQAVPLAIVFSVKPTFSGISGIFSLATAISVTLNIVAGFVQVLFYLHKAGKLTFAWCV